MEGRQGGAAMNEEQKRPRRFGAFRLFLSGVSVGAVIGLGSLVLGPGKYPQVSVAFGALVGGLFGLLIGAIRHLIGRRPKQKSWPNPPVDTN